MYMVGHAARPVTFAAGIARDGSKVSMKFWPRAGIEQRAALLCAENNVNDNKA